MHPVIEEILEATKRRGFVTGQKKTTERRDFREIIKAKKQQKLIPVIAELKFASPTRFIREVRKEDVPRIAGEMEAGGASAISVLTEPDFFKGSLENLGIVRQAVTLPVLRKDFIIDKAQIFESECDLLLLIAGILGEKLNDFVDTCISFGCEPMVEVHNEKEVEKALSTNARIIGINNRDLNSMRVDISTTEKLAPLISNRIVVSESGISSQEDAVRMIDAGADALLVGTYIMQGNIYDRTYELVHALR